MKKLIITIAIVLGLNSMAFAGNGLFQRGIDRDEEQVFFLLRSNNVPILPYQHDLSGNQDADAVPLGSGVLALIGLGYGYAMAKRKKKE